MAALAPAGLDGLGLARVVAAIAPGNAAALGLAARHGMTACGTERMVRAADGTEVTMLLFELARRDRRP